MSFGSFIGDLAVEGAKAFTTTAASAGAKKLVVGSGGGSVPSGLGSMASVTSGAAETRWNTTDVKPLRRHKFKKARTVDPKNVWDDDPDELTESWINSLSMDV